MQSRPSHLADHVHHLGLAGALAALVDDGQVAVQPGGDVAGALHAADVGRDDDDVAPVEPLADVAGEQRLGVEVVHGNVEEALNLRGVQIHGQHAVGARPR